MTGSIVEAAIDDFTIFDFDCGSAPCPGDLDGSGAIDGRDLGLLLGGWGGAGPADLDGDGVVGTADLAILVGAWTG